MDDPKGKQYKFQVFLLVAAQNRDDSEFYGLILICLLTFTTNLIDSSFNRSELYFHLKTIYLGL